MAIISGNYTANTGRDLSMKLMSPLDGTIVSIPNLQSLSYQQTTHAISRDRIDGTIFNAELPMGWSGTIEADRDGGQIDLLFSQIQALWVNNGAYQTSDLYIYVTETGGAQTTVHFTNVALKLSDGGTFKSDQVVTQRIAFTAGSMLVAVS